MPATLDAIALDQLFREARTRYGWSDTPVTVEQIHQIYDLMKLAPTSANSSPARFVWVHTAEGKDKLLPHVAEGNKAKVLEAPVTVIIGHDVDFNTRMPELFPHNPGAKDWWPDPKVREEAAFRNGTLQGAYLMMAARAIGLDCGPMSGFDNAGVDAAFFAGTAIKSNFICSLGYGTDKGVFPRAPRLAFDDANTLI
ncbi:MAG: malonic semialdehyde reductase [Asticcacaulis sp.]